ncbi:MAG: protein kinase domain-containing protein, partial [Gemmatimonadales bacterium]
VNADRFRREIQLAARLQHPHIVPLLTAGARDDLLFYTMPFIEGESLRARLERAGELPVAETIGLIREIVDALAHAHARAIVHRDIKPENVLLSGRHALVADFGVAKAMSSSSGATSLTSLGMALGTPAYMAPEQAAGDPNVDHRADLYAVGILAYEMLCGRPPFIGGTPQAVLAAQVTQSPEPCTVHRPMVPPALTALVMSLLQKHPADRPQSADLVLAQLDAIAGSTGAMTPVATTPVGTAPVTGNATVSSGTQAAIRQGHPLRVIALFAVATIIVLAVVYLLVQELGLPDWVWIGAIALMVAGLPIMILTGLAERRRARGRATGATVENFGRSWRGWFTWRRAVMGGVVAFALLGIVAAGYTAMRLMGVGPVGTLVASGVLAREDRLIVAEFQNRSSADSLLARSVTEALRIDLAQSQIIRVANGTAIEQALVRMNRPPDTPLDPEVATEIAEREGMKAVLLGQIDPVGNGYVISARLVSPGTGQELLSLRESADDDNGLIPAIDRLSSRLRERIGESLKTIRDNQPLERVTTESMEALRKYTQAIRANDAGEVDRAIALLEEATTIDTGFAMAFRKKAVLLSNTFVSKDRVVQAATRAYAHRDRLPEIERQHAIAFYHRTVDFDEDKTARAYRAVLDQDPDDLVSLNNLALVYGGRRQYAAAESLYRRAAALDTTSRVFGGNLVEILVLQEKVEEAGQVLDRYLAAPATARLFLPFKGAMNELRGHPDSAHAVWQSMLESEADLSMQDLLLFQLSALDRRHGKLNESARHGEALMQVALERKVPAIRTMFALWNADRIRIYENDPESAVASLEAGTHRFPLDSVPVADRPYLDLASFYAVTGSPQSARELLREWERTVPEGLRRGSTRARNVEGTILLAEGKPLDALPHLRFAVDSGCRNCGWGLELGQAYEALGQPDSAVLAYERELEPELFGHESDFDSRAIVLRRLGELHEARGNRQKAVEYYTQFTELWKAADPELQPQVREIKDRMARLIGENPSN